MNSVFDEKMWHWDDTTLSECWWFISLDKDHVLRIPPVDETVVGIEVLQRRSLAGEWCHEWHRIDQCRH